MTDSLPLEPSPAPVRFCEHTHLLQPYSLYTQGVVHRLCGNCYTQALADARERLEADRRKARGAA